MPKREKTGRCLSCKEVAKMTEHHLHPKETNGITIQIIMLCDTCHRELHKKFTNKELDEL